MIWTIISVLILGLLGVIVWRLMTTYNTPDLDPEYRMQVYKKMIENSNRQMRQVDVTKLSHAEFLLHIYAIQKGQFE